MRWPAKRGNNWRRMFALVPVEVGDEWVWLEWYWSCWYGEGVWREKDDPREKYP